MNEIGEYGIYKLYLCDLVVHLLEMANEAKRNASNNPTEFDLGYLSGFHRVVSLMQQQADGFGIALEDIYLDKIDANTDLV